jgi:hypothetical protein
LQRKRHWKTKTLRVGEHDVTVLTLPEILRIKAHPCVTPNATRDHIDLVALASDATAEALSSMDELYPQRNGDTRAVRTQTW